VIFGMDLRFRNTHSARTIPILQSFLETSWFASLKEQIVMGPRSVPEHICIHEENNKGSLPNLKIMALIIKLIIPCLNCNALYAKKGLECPFSFDSLFDSGPGKRSGNGITCYCPAGWIFASEINVNSALRIYLKKGPE